MTAESPKHSAGCSVTIDNCHCCCSHPACRQSTTGSMSWTRRQCLSRLTSTITAMVRVSLHHLQKYFSHITGSRCSRQGDFLFDSCVSADKHLAAVNSSLHSTWACSSTACTYVTAAQHTATCQAQYSAWPRHKLPQPKHQTHTAPRTTPHTPTCAATERYQGPGSRHLCHAQPRSTMLHTTHTAEPAQPRPTAHSQTEYPWTSKAGRNAYGNSIHER